MERVIDVATAKDVKLLAGAGREYHRGQQAWWALSVFSCPKHPKDGHMFEVCLFNVGPSHCSPTWPILGLTTEEDANFWMEQMRDFAKGISAEDSALHFDKDVNGDKRLADWLTINGFKRFNHVWWIKTYDA